MSWGDLHGDEDEMDFESVPVFDMSEDEEGDEAVNRGEEGSGEVDELGNGMFEFDEDDRRVFAAGAGGVVESTMPVLAVMTPAAPTVDVDENVSSARSYFIPLNDTGDGPKPVRRVSKDGGVPREKRRERKKAVKLDLEGTVGGEDLSGIWEMEGGVVGVGKVTEKDSASNRVPKEAKKKRKNGSKERRHREKKEKERKDGLERPRKEGRKGTGQ